MAFRRRVRKEVLKTLLGDEALTKVRESRILVVGAGGIGCELLKNLVMSGFRYIEVVDLDTIDVSNLNRQFLFRPHHVGKAKAEVAREAVLKFCPEATVISHHANIKNSAFNIEYVRGFTLVLNALDNVDARRHVNRLCLAADRPLVESGSTGYLGQVTVIKKGETECYECTEKVTQKVYPICTIRSTPEKPVHCIVWAKESYKLLFGKMEDSMLFEAPDSAEKSAFMHLVQRPRDITSESTLKYAEDVFQGLFYYEIKKKLAMDTYRTAKKAPIPLALEEIRGPERQFDIDVSEVDDQSVWTIKFCADVFIQCILDMWKTESTRELIGDCEFDKDDSLAMAFVTAASNLRAHVFGIPLQTLHDAKGVAGNIIPAIATTNAIIAGTQVLEALRVVTGSGSVRDICRYTYCKRIWDQRGALLAATSICPPNPDCYVCSAKQMDLEIDVECFTLREMVDRVLKKKLGMNEPSVMIGMNTIFEEGEDADESLHKNLDKKLTNLPAGGIQNGTHITVEDFSQDFDCHIIVKHRDDLDEEEVPELFLLHGHEETSASTNGTLSMENGASASSANDEPQNVQIDHPVAKSSAKRRRDSGQLDDQASKKPKIDQDVDGAIEID